MLVAREVFSDCGGLGLARAELEEALEATGSKSLDDLGSVRFSCAVDGAYIVLRVILPNGGDAEELMLRAKDKLAALRGA